MKVDRLDPAPTGRAPFTWNQIRTIPDHAGCYALATVSGDIIYIGLAINLRQRLIQHLDTPEKVAATAIGKARYVHWRAATDPPQLERTWMNWHLVEEGALPVLNKAYSPVTV